MRTRAYTLHLPAPGSLDAMPDAEALERATLVPDGFSWTAFAFSALWFFWHRLWLAGLLVALGIAAVWGLGLLLPLNPGAGTLIALLLSLLIGLEASSLRRWTLARRGRPAVDVVAAGSRAEAEARLIARHLGADVAPVASSPAVARGGPGMGLGPRGGDAVIGLFPEAERRP